MIKEVEVRKRMDHWVASDLLRGAQIPIAGNPEDYLRDVVSVEPHVYVSLSDEELKKLPIDKEALKTKMELILRRNNIPLYEGEGYYKLLFFTISGLVNNSNHLIYNYKLDLKGLLSTYNNGIARGFSEGVWETGSLGYAGECRSRKPRAYPTTRSQKKK